MDSYEKNHEEGPEDINKGLNNIPSTKEVSMAAKNEAKEGLSHAEATVEIKNLFSNLIQNDPLLCDLPHEVTPDEVNSQIALEYGQAMVVSIRREDGNVYNVVVVQNATVSDLKKAIQRHVTLIQKRIGGPTVLSWRYIWRSYYLIHNGVKLADDNKLLKGYGIGNHSELSFLKRLKVR